MKLEKRVTVVRAKYGEETKVFELFDQDPELASTFNSDYRHRLTCSEVFFIKLDNDIIGFISIVFEKNRNTLDTGILTKYQNDGIGTYALKIIRDRLIASKEEYIIETHTNNKAANMSLKKAGFELSETNGKINIYKIKPII